MMKLLPFFIGPLVYFLVVNQVVSQVCADEVSAALEFIFGGALFLGSLALGVFHHKKADDAETAQEAVQYAYLKKLVEALKAFAVKKPQEPQKPTSEI